MLPNQLNVSSINRFVYANSSPIIAADPSGYMLELLTRKAVAYSVGIAAASSVAPGVDSYLANSTNYDVGRAFAIGFGVGFVLSPLCSVEDIFNCSFRLQPECISDDSERGFREHSLW